MSCSSSGSRFKILRLYRTKGLSDIRDCIYSRDSLQSYDVRTLIFFMVPRLVFVNTLVFEAATKQRGLWGAGASRQYRYCHIQFQDEDAGMSLQRKSSKSTRIWKEVRSKPWLYDDYRTQQSKRSKGAF